MSGNFLFFFLLFFVFVASGQNKYLEAEDHYDRAIDHYRKKEFGMAREQVDLAIQIQPNAARYYLSGLIFEAVNKELRAVAEYEATIRRDPGFSEAYFQKGLIYLKYNDPEQALRDFDHLLDKGSPTETRSIYYEVDEQGGGVNALLTLSNLQARLFNYRGQANQKLSNFEDALVDYSTALKLNPHPDYYVSRGLLKLTIKNDTGAVRDFNRAIELQPDHQLAYYNLVLLDPNVELPETLLTDEQFSPTLNLMAARALEREEYPLALSYYNRILEEHEDVLSLINRGRVLSKLKRQEAARHDFEKARYMEPSRFEAFYLIGNTYFFEKQYENAIAYYNQYLAVDPTHAMTCYNVAMAYLELGEDKEACHFLAKAQYLGMAEANGMIEAHCR